MDHWRSRFINRPLTRSIYLAVRWTNLTELWIAYTVRQALSRLRFLRAIEVDFDRVDLEQHLRYQARVNAALVMHSPQYQPLPPETRGARLPLGDQARGIWV